MKSKGASSRECDLVEAKDLFKEVMVQKKLSEMLEKKCTFETDERNVLVCEPVDSSRT
ncbi:MAG: hypothetical protein AB9866_20470 [Syntrophobacteraceae bacterium]